LRRRLLVAAFAKASAAGAAGLTPAARLVRAALAYPEATPRRFTFPRDFGAHLPFRTEWWYLTGQLDPGPGSRDPRLGLQLTFFRTHPAIDPDNPSRFAAHQLVLAHAAIADPRRGALLHEERLARTGFGIASVSESDTQVDVDRWRLARDAATGIYHGQVQAAQFTLELSATPTQPPLAQGQDGYFRKEPEGNGSVAASLYYSEPQLALQARVRIAGAGIGGRTRADAADVMRGGRGWLDHEWFSTLLPAEATGWDWVGFNLDDGSALTAFQIRRGSIEPAGSAWLSYASLRSASSRVQTFASNQVRFEPLQTWTSPRTRAAYPVAQRIAVGSRQFETRPLMSDQELDARTTSGIAYWEGASDLLEGGRTVGRGYLELTGYAGRVPGSD
jgi:predicted secreted hydrolase